MTATFTIELDGVSAAYGSSESPQRERVTRADLGRLVGRRHVPKLATPALLAQALYLRFDIEARILCAGGDPHATPIVVCNRFAGWDHVAPAMTRDVGGTLDAVGPYVATAWFPASIQGHLTIACANVGEAITIASDDEDLIAATIEALFTRDAEGARRGVVLLGAFECLPPKIAGSALDGAAPGAFGAMSVVSADDDHATLTTLIDRHRRLYDRFAL